MISGIKGSSDCPCGSRQVGFSFSRSQATEAPNRDTHVRHLCKAEHATFRASTEGLLSFKGKTHKRHRYKEDIATGSRRRLLRPLLVSLRRNERPSTQSLER